MTPGDTRVPRVAVAGVARPTLSTAPYEIRR